MQPDKHIPNNDVILNKEKVIEELRRIRWVDKYHTFRNLIPEACNSSEEEQQQIVDILEECCTKLIRIYNRKKKPTKAAVRKTILLHMDLISYSTANTENKDFGYEICWYIAEKTGCELRKHSQSKVYGYWKVENETLKPVTRRSKKQSD